MHLNDDFLHCTCIGQKPKDKLKDWLHTPAVGKYVKDTPTRCLHTPAEGKSPRCGPLHSQGYYASRGPQTSVWGPKSLKIPQKQPKHPFLSFGSQLLGPLVAKSKYSLAIPCGLA